MGSPNLTIIPQTKSPIVRQGFKSEMYGILRVIRVRLKLTANGLKEHCHLKLNLDIATHTYQVKSPLNIH